MHSTSDFDLVKFTDEDKILFQTRYEEGYDLDDPKYRQWLKLHHVADVSDDISVECIRDPSPVSPSVTSSPSILSTCAPDSVCSNLSSTSSVAAVESASSSYVLSEVLSLPRPKQSAKNRKPGFNSQAVCLTDDSIIQELEDKAEAKCHREEKKEARRIERDHKRKEREKKREEQEQKAAQKKNEREQKHAEKTSKKGRTGRHAESKEITSDSESEAECPVYGHAYGDSDSVWICCDSCNKWFHVKCTVFSENDIPDEYVCVACL